MPRKTISPPFGAPYGDQERDYSQPVKFTEALSMLIEAGLGSPNPDPLDPERMLVNRERREQRKAINTMKLPTENLDDYRSDGKYAALGFKIGKPVPGDPLFTEAELPVGWTKGPSDHSMYVNIYDEKGRKRVRFFYKGAFYDRSAFMWNPERRYSTTIGERDERNTRAHRIIIDSTLAKYDSSGRMIEPSAVLHSIELEPLDGEKSWELSDRINKTAADWLNDHYPQWTDPLAYWD